MSESASPSGSPEPAKRRGGWLLSALLGFAVGALAIAIIGWQTMPGMMLVVHPSKFDTVEETCRQLESAIAANGWQSPGVRDMNASMAKQGVAMQRPVRLVELCNANHAKQVLATNPEVSTMMPCAWGVYEGDDGRVYIAGMNMGLMGTLFGGRIAEVMGGAVAAEEKRMLSGVIAD